MAGLETRPTVEPFGKWMPGITKAEDVLVEFFAFRVWGLSSTTLPLPTQIPDGPSKPGWIRSFVLSDYILTTDPMGCGSRLSGKNVFLRTKTG
jgi:hypothetical protein